MFFVLDSPSRIGSLANPSISHLGRGRGVAVGEEGPSISHLGRGRGRRWRCEGKPRGRDSSAERARGDAGEKYKTLSVSRLRRGRGVLAERRGHDNGGEGGGGSSKKNKDNGPSVSLLGRRRGAATKETAQERGRGHGSKKNKRTPPPSHIWSEGETEGEEGGCQQEVHLVFGAMVRVGGTEPPLVREGGVWRDETNATSPSRIWGEGVRHKCQGKVHDSQREGPMRGR